MGISTPLFLTKSAERYDCKGVVEYACAKESAKSAETIEKKEVHICMLCRGNQPSQEPYIHLVGRSVLPDEEDFSILPELSQRVNGALPANRLANGWIRMLG